MRPPDDDTSQPPALGKRDNPSKTTAQSTESIVREGVGSGMVTISDLVNNNLVAFRYGTVATVTLLTAYGLANTPLFFRYKRVADIPARLFSGRKRLRVRLIKVEENDQAGQAITCYVRHLSPAGSVLSRDLYELAAKMAPSAQAEGGISNDASRDMMKIEIACLSAPPFYTSRGYQRGDWLRRLAEEKTTVKLQMMGRRVAETPTNEKSTRKDQTKRDVTAVLPEMHSTLDKDFTESKRGEGEEQIAVCQVSYRPSLFQFFSTDLAESLVRYGHACVESEVYMHNEHSSETRVIDASSRLEDLRKDVKYLDRLESNEYKAAEGSYGMWSDSMIREKRRDIVDEIEFRANANIFQRLWRWVRG